MTPPTKDEDQGWRHQALVDVKASIDKDHARLRRDLEGDNAQLRRDLEEEKGIRRELERKLDLLMREVHDDLKATYLRKDLFDIFLKSVFGPVQRGFYATIGLITTTVILSILYLVLKH